MIVKQVMSKPVKIGPKASRNEIIKTFRKHKVDTVIVVDKKGVFLGEIHETDLLNILIPDDQLDYEEVIDLLGVGFEKKFFAKNAEELMDTHEFKCTPETPLLDIALMMYREEVRAVPVIEKNKIVGVVTLRDVIMNI